jgi:hypothetical protein
LERVPGKAWNASALASPPRRSQLDVRAPPPGPRPPISREVRGLIVRIASESPSWVICGSPVSCESSASLSRRRPSATFSRRLVCRRLPGATQQSWRAFQPTLTTLVRPSDVSTFAQARGALPSSPFRSLPGWA